MFQVQASSELRRCFDLLAPELKFKTPSDSPLILELLDSSSTHLQVKRSGQRCTIVAAKRHLGRALTLLAQALETENSDFSLEEKPFAPRCGSMLDCSRNAVPRVETLQYLLRKLSLMGYTVCQLYCEETYVVDGLPEWGHLRGSYTADELRALDDYADALGIELVPCIQTLGHLERALHWDSMAAYRDTTSVLLVGEEKVYELIERLLLHLKTCFRTRRIHIGMDEAWDLGTGRYKRRFGLKEGSEIMQEHLKRLQALLEKHGWSALMWSDMYFRLASKNFGYYDLEACPNEEILKIAPPEIDLVYWDYYHEEPSFYQRYLSYHQAFQSKTVLACGTWSWTGPAPQHEKFVRSALPALQAAAETGLEEVLLTSWGDSGQECNLLATLFCHQVFADYVYTQIADEEASADRFHYSVAGEASFFRRLQAFDAVPGLQHPTLSPANPARVFLYMDPLLPTTWGDYAHLPVLQHYEVLKQDYTQLAPTLPEALQPFVSFYGALATLLFWNANWQVHAQALALQQQAGIALMKRRQKAKELELAQQAHLESIETLRQAWKQVWYKYNKANGFEILDLRLGGLKARYQTAYERLTDFAEGRLEQIEEFQEQHFPLYTNSRGEIRCVTTWPECASAAVME